MLFYLMFILSAQLFLPVNCMYWERRYPRLLTTQQFQDLMKNGCRLVGISDISCDIEGSIEFINQTTSIDSPFFRYNLVCVMHSPIGSYLLIWIPGSFGKPCIYIYTFLPLLISQF